VFRFQLVALSGKKFDDDVYEVILPTLDGEIGVLENHMPLFSVATNGSITVKRQSNDAGASHEIFACSGGAIDVAGNTLRVLVDEADRAEDINEAEVQKALGRAQKMKAEAKDEVSLEHAQTLVDRSEVRLQVAGLKRRHQKH
jgi:F-type H+-transporting ATPase subunit epsilon